MLYGKELVTVKKEITWWQVILIILGSLIPPILVLQIGVHIRSELYETPEERLEAKYGIDFVVEEINRNPYPNKDLYFCHPANDESIRFAMYEEDEELTDDFLEQMILQDIYQKVEEEFEAAGIEMCYQGYIGRDENEEGKIPERDYWEDETDYQMARADFEAEYAERMYYQIYVVLKRSDFETIDDIEKIWNITRNCSLKTSARMRLSVVWVSDARFDEISDYFSMTPYTYDYTAYSYRYTSDNRVTFFMQAGEELVYGDGEKESMENCYELFLERKDWDDSAPIWTSVVR